MKRWLTVGVAGAVATALATACTGCGGPLDPGTDDPHTLVVHSRFAPGTYGADTYASVVAQFERENPDVHIKNLYNGDDIFNSFETARLADKEADVLLINLYDKAYSWTELGATPPVNRYLKEWGLKDRVESRALKAWTDDKGRVRAFPWTGFTWPVLVNSKLLHRAGVEKPPRTMPELRAALKALRAANIPAMTIGGNDWSGQKFLMQVAQGYMEPAVAKRVFSEGGYCAEPQARKGLRLFAQLRDAGLFVKGAQGLNADQMNADYLEERAAMMPAISSTIAAVPAPLARHTEIAGFPVPSDGTYDKPTVYNGATSTGIWLTPNGTEKPDLTEKFVKFLYRKDVVQKFIDKSGYVMTMRGQRPSKGRPLVSESSRVTHGDTVSEAVMPDDYVPPAVSTPLNRATSLAYTRGTDVQAMCKALDTAYRS
ncbi:ABC transporter substrate-binding protein [Streptomyces olivaceiscleroticus]|uniref:ABC transporter substrate-binding protein n=1 Tax=Streptomyces olivaceiscleroticus TaxID=68245 RepID=A0ABN1A1U7_9ACTN